MKKNIVIGLMLLGCQSYIVSSDPSREQFSRKPVLMVQVCHQSRFPGAGSCMHTSLNSEDGLVSLGSIRLSEELNRAARAGDRIKARAILDQGNNLSSAVLRKALLFGHLEYECLGNVGNERDRMVVIDMIRHDLISRREQ